MGGGSLSLPRVQKKWFKSPCRFPSTGVPMTVRQVDYEPKPIDPDFLQKPDEYPVTGEHFGHKVLAEAIARYALNRQPYPTKLGIHGTHVATDFEACVAAAVGIHA